MGHYAEKRGRRSAGGKVLSGYAEPRENPALKSRFKCANMTVLEVGIF